MIAGYFRTIIIVLCLTLLWPGNNHAIGQEELKLPDLVAGQFAAGEIVPFKKNFHPGLPAEPFHLLQGSGAIGQVDAWRKGIRRYHVLLLKRGNRNGLRR